MHVYVRAYMRLFTAIVQTEGEKHGLIALCLCNTPINLCCTSYRRRNKLADLWLLCCREWADTRFGRKCRLIELRILSNFLIQLCPALK